MITHNVCFGWEIWNLFLGCLDISQKGQKAGTPCILDTLLIFFSHELEGFCLNILYCYVIYIQQYKTHGSYQLHFGTKGKECFHIWTVTWIFIVSIFLYKPFACYKQESIPVNFSIFTLNKLMWKKQAVETSVWLLPIRNGSSICLCDIY